MKQFDVNLLWLSLAMALTLTTHILIFPVLSLVGKQLTHSNSLAVVPLCLSYLSATFYSLVAARLMQKKGRRFGFFIGCFAAMLASFLGIYSIAIESYWLFNLSALVYGVQLGTYPFYRFAALEASKPGFESKALGLVMSGGILAALLGPTLSSLSVNLLNWEYAGNYLMLLPLLFAVSAVLSQVTLILPSSIKSSRGLKEILSQPQFLLALSSSAIGYGVMSLIMIITAVSMKTQGFTFAEITSVIKWHLLGMFLPSFFTGHLIKRFGVYQVILGGVLFCFVSVYLNLGEMTLGLYILSLLSLGVGWNFLYLGSTRLLTLCYSPNEAGVVQGFNESLTLAVNATCALGAGLLFERTDWSGVSLSAIPALVGVLFLVLIMLYISRFKRA